MDRDPLEEIFTKATQAKGVFLDRHYLSSEYIPDNLPFREEQIKAIGECLSALLRGGKPSNILLYGKTGTGKTAVAKYVMKRLEDKTNQLSIPITMVYTNTRLAGTEYKVLAELASALEVGVPFTGLAISEVLSRVMARLRSKPVNTLLILDEIDHLIKNYGDDLLYELTRIGDKISPSTLTLIGISNDLRFKEFLDPRVLSSLGEEEIVFPPYTSDELCAILEERARKAFRPNAIDGAAINLCAALAASEHGDARRALELLRVAGEMAERQGDERITEAHIKQALHRIEQDRMVEAIASLPLQSKLVLLSILRLREGSSTGEIYKHYCELARRVGLEVLTTRRISGLIAELDMLGLASASVISKGRYGRSKRVQLTIPAQIIKQALAEDPLLSSLA